MKVSSRSDQLVPFEIDFLCVHLVVEWAAAELQSRAFLLATAFFWMDGGESLRSLARDEPILPIVESGTSDTILSAPEMIAKHWQTVQLRAECECRLGDQNSSH